MKIDFVIKPFFEDIDYILKTSDFVIARSGAGSINDIVKKQVPSILVPLPNSINNHQYFNAKFLFDKKAAILVQEKDLLKDETYFEFSTLLNNSNKRSILINNLQSINLLDANKLMFEKIAK